MAADADATDGAQLTEISPCTAVQPQRRGRWGCWTPSCGRRRRRWRRRWTPRQIQRPRTRWTRLHCGCRPTGCAYQVLGLLVAVVVLFRAGVKAVRGSVDVHRNRRRWGRQLSCCVACQLRVLRSFAAYEDLPPVRPSSAVAASGANSITRCLRKPNTLTCDTVVCTLERCSVAGRGAEADASVRGGGGGPAVCGAAPGDGPSRGAAGGGQRPGVRRADAAGTLFPSVGL